MLKQRPATATLESGACHLGLQADLRDGTRRQCFVRGYCA
jgi:hypothetical protein